MATGKVQKILYIDKSLSASAASNITLRTTPIIGRYGEIVTVTVYFDTTATIANNARIVNFTSNLPLPIGQYAVAPIRSVITGSTGMVQLERANTSYLSAWGSISAGQYYYCELIYIVAR